MPEQHEKHEQSKTPHESIEQHKDPRELCAGKEQHEPRKESYELLHLINHTTEVIQDLQEKGAKHMPVSKGGEQDVSIEKEMQKKKLMQE
eukprot:11189119-Ditylum_brightwellii.AAC.1